jgi:DNA replication protein DnaC
MPDLSPEQLAEVQKLAESKRTKGPPVRKMGSMQEILDRVKAYVAANPHEYCAVCDYPLLTDGGKTSCLECENRRGADRAQVSRWIERMGGRKAWNKYTRARFVRTAYNYQGLAAAEVYSPRQSVIFWGPRGTGKSHLSAIAKRPLVVAGVDVVTYNMPDLTGHVDSFKENFKDAKVLQQEVTRMISAAVLSLEDVGAEAPSKKVMELYWRIVDGRYRDDKSGLVITMNQSLEDLELYWRKYDAPGRVVSRLRELCGPRIFSLAGEKDWRAEPQHG